VEDLLVALDGHPVEGIEDAKIALFFKRPGDTINVKIHRPGLFTSGEDMEFTVKLE
jgi:S1-C subfamily serine protease